jgi:uncharacterized membrane protein
MMLIDDARHLYKDNRRMIILFFIAACIIATAFFLGYIMGRDLAVAPIVIQKADCSQQQ